MHASSPRASVLALATLLALALAGFAGPGRAETLPQVTNLAALSAFPDFYVDRTIVVRGELRDLNGRLSIEDSHGHRVIAVWKTQARPGGLADMTGVLWDLGRMKQGDPRLAGYDLASVVGTGADTWPLPGQVFVFAGQKFVSADEGPQPATTVRSLVLEGPHAVGRQVTVVGQFGGRNLFGDLPRAPGLGHWDFVIRSSGAAVWVSGMQPRGKDFDFDPDKRIDSNRWLQVTGTVREVGNLMVIEATKLALSQPGATDRAEDLVVQVTRVPPAAPPEVVFTVPVEGETDVPTSVVVKIQLSRPVERTSLVRHMRASYVVPSGTPVTWIPATVDVEERSDAPSGAIAVLVVHFTQPLERFKTVRLELLDGIKAPDGQALKPWQLTFTVGGQ